MASSASSAIATSLLPLFGNHILQWSGIQHNIFLTLETTITNNTTECLGLFPGNQYPILSEEAEWVIIKLAVPPATRPWVYQCISVKSLYLKKSRSGVSGCLINLFPTIVNICPIQNSVCTFRKCEVLEEVNPVLKVTIFPL